MGLASPMTWWDPELCAMLAGRGYYVIRFDNRDVGRSSRAGAGSPAGCSCEAFAGRRMRAPYSLATWPTTPSGCWTTSGSRRAHVVGVSMGGMIAQTMAIEQPGAGCGR